MTTPMSEIDAYLQEETKRIETLVISALAKLGDLCVSEARERTQEASWFDQSGNLRSSVGYVVVAHGFIVKTSSFNTVKQGSEGSNTGKKLAENLASRYSTGYALIVVAGMNYAERVEALDNKVVLASAELFARKELPGMMEKLKNQA